MGAALAMRAVLHLHQRCVAGRDFMLNSDLQGIVKTGCRVSECLETLNLSRCLIGNDGCRFIGDAVGCY